MSDLTLVGLCGSLRAASTNKLLMQEAARRFDPATFIEGDIRFPLFDEDDESATGIPAEVHLLADQIAGADAVIVATPEYNKGIPGGLKNALDWVSRTKGAPWRDKPVAVMSASAGAQGGARSHSMVRTLLLPFRPRLIPGPEVMVAQSSKQFDEDGRMTNEFGIKLITELMDQLRTEAMRARQS